MAVFGFVGTGTMGRPMARCVLDAGHRVVVHDARREAAAPLVSAGAEWVASPREVAERCPVVLTSLPGPPEVDEVVRGADGLLAGARDGSVHVDLTTVSVAFARRLAGIEAAHGVRYADAPVSGGVFAAERGTLTVMASGDPAAIDAARPALTALGERIFDLGAEPGTGTLVKLVNNAVFLCSGLVLQEGLVLAAKAGLAPRDLLRVLQASSAAVYLGLAEPTLARQFDDVWFALALAEKDVALALESGGDLAVPMPVTAAAHGVYARALAEGLGAKLFLATLESVARAAGVTLPQPESSQPPA